MKIFFVNPAFKAEYGRFSRENRSPTVTRSGTLYYPLWLMYSAAVCEADGFEVEFLDAPAYPMNDQQMYEYIRNHGEGTKLFVINTSTPSIVNDTACADRLKKTYTDAFVMMVGTHPSALPDETLNNSESVDAVARHEYDYSVRDVARAIRDGNQPTQTIGLTYKTSDGEIVSNPDMPYI